MSEIKQCLQCNQKFVGRRNRLYCCDDCKTEAFRAGKTRLAIEPAPEIGAPPLSPVPIHPPSKQPRLGDRPPTGLSKLDLIAQRQAFNHALKMKKMDMNHEERRQKHEQALARINAGEPDQAAKFQQLSKKVEDLQEELSVQQRPKPVDEVDESPVPLPLDEWSYFPIGIRRQYQAFVRAVLKAADEPMPSSFCQQWLAEYGPYEVAVQAFLEQNDSLPQLHTPFIWLAGLAQQLAVHKRVNDRSVNSQGSVFIIPSSLRQQLMEACL